MTVPAEAMTRRLRDDLKTAMQAKQADRARLLRVVIAAIDNAEAIVIDGTPGQLATSFASGAAEAPRRVLSAGDIDDLLAAEIAARRQAAADYARLGRADEAARLLAEADVVAGYRES